MSPSNTSVLIGSFVIAAVIAFVCCTLLRKHGHDEKITSRNDMSLPWQNCLKDETLWILAFFAMGLMFFIGYAFFQGKWLLEHTLIGVGALGYLFAGIVWVLILCLRKIRDRMSDHLEIQSRVRRQLEERNAILEKRVAELEGQRPSDEGGKGAPGLSGFSKFLDESSDRIANIRGHPDH